jgi:hypothetical protein
VNTVVDDIASLPTGSIECWFKSDGTHHLRIFNMGDKDSAGGYTEFSFTHVQSDKKIYIQILESGVTLTIVQTSDTFDLIFGIMLL